MKSSKTVWSCCNCILRQLLFVSHEKQKISRFHSQSPSSQIRLHMLHPPVLQLLKHHQTDDNRNDN